MDIKCISIKFHENRTSSFSVLFILVPLILSFRNAQLLEEMIADTKFYGQSSDISFYTVPLIFMHHGTKNYKVDWINK